MLAWLREYSYVFFSILISTIAFLFVLRVHIIKILSNIIKNISKRNHAYVSYIMTDTYNKAVFEYKKQFFEEINEDIIKNGDHVYELGAGSGGNLDFYTTNAAVKLIAIEPNEFCKQYLVKNLKDYEQIKLQKYILNAGEDLKDIPNNTVSILITTIVLCSVEDPEKVVNEIKRVLKPNGRFYFMEHVIAEKATSLYKFQQVFSSIWRLCFDGCNLNRDTTKVIENAGFATINCTRFEAKLDFLFKGLRPHIYGYAQK